MPVMTRKAAAQDMELKLRTALHELKESNLKVQQLLQEREESEVEIIKFGISHKPWSCFRCTKMEGDMILRYPNLDAKRIVARMILEQLSRRGYLIPPVFANPDAIHKLLDDAGVPTQSFVVLVNELCVQYRLDPVEYELMADAAGVEFFTVKARIGYVERVATGPTKRMAQQCAAEQIYRYLRTKLSRTCTFDEEQAMYVAYERAMARDSDEEEEEEQKRKQEEEEAARRQPEAKKMGKKSKNSLGVEDTVRMEKENSENGSDEGGLQAKATDEKGAEASGNHDKAMRFVARTLSRLGL